MGAVPGGGAGGGGGRVRPYKGLIGPCRQPGYVFWDFCLKQVVSILSLFVLIRLSILSIFVLNRVSFLGR